MSDPWFNRSGWRRGLSRRVAILLLSGLVFSLPPPAEALAQAVPAEHPATHPFAPHIAEATQRFGIPEHWIAAVLRAESAGDARAVSSAGAMGLMQVMPDTWEELRTRHRFGNDPFDPRDNILAGAAYLREMWDRYGNVAAMLAAYNAGPGRYDEYLTAGRTLPAETRSYVAALAPILAGQAPPAGIATLPPPPGDWRDALLFVTRSTDTPIAGPIQPGSQSNGTPAALPVQEDGATDDGSGGIFVSRSNAGQAQ